MSCLMIAPGSGLLMQTEQRFRRFRGELRCDKTRLIGASAAQSARSGHNMVHSQGVDKILQQERCVPSVET